MRSELRTIVPTGEVVTTVTVVVVVSRKYWSPVTGQPNSISMRDHIADTPEDGSETERKRPPSPPLPTLVHPNFPSGKSLKKSYTSSHMRLSVLERTSVYCIPT